MHCEKLKCDIVYYPRLDIIDMKTQTTNYKIEIIIQKNVYLSILSIRDIRSLATPLHHNCVPPSSATNRQTCDPRAVEVSKGQDPSTRGPLCSRSTSKRVSSPSIQKMSRTLTHSISGWTDSRSNPLSSICDRGGVRLTIFNDSNDHVPNRAPSTGFSSTPKTFTGSTVTSLVQCFSPTRCWHITNQNVCKCTMMDSWVFFEHLNKTKRLESTVLVFFGDHGMREGGFRKTTQGKLEERLPFMSITLPPLFHQKYPDEVRNLKRNSEVMTTPYDIHVTLKHLLESFPKVPKPHPYGRSLFTDIVALNRDCQDAAINSFWCVCSKYEPVQNVNDDLIVQQVAKSMVDIINEIILSTSPIAGEKCYNVSLNSISRASKMVKKFHDSKSDAFPNLRSCVHDESLRRTLRSNRRVRLKDWTN